MSDDAANPATSWSLLPSLVGSSLAAIAFLLAYPYASAYLESLIHVDDYRIREGNLEKLLAARLNTPPALADASSRDWPQYRGPRGDGVSAAPGLLTAWPSAGLPVLWKIAGGPGFSSLAVVGSRVYTMWQDGDDEAVVCLEADTGKELWRHGHPCTFTEQFSGLGPRATPTIHDGKVYALGSRGQMVCLQAEDGKLVWQLDLTQTFNAAVPEYGYSVSPLVVDKQLIVMPGGAPGSSVVGLDKDDGKTLWKIADDRPAYSTPAVATLGGKRQIVCATAESLLGLTPEDGRLLWSYPWPSFLDCNVATPIVIGDYVFMSTGYNKGCVLLEIANRPDGTQQAQPVYEHNRMCNHFSTCVLHNEHLYGFDNAFLVCMALRTGKIMWKERGFSKGTVLLADGKLLVLGEYGKLAIADASPERFRAHSTFTLTDTRCWTIPALADGKLYVRDEKHVWCVDLRAGKP
jgi:outer membrane protein assembly factor BamB